MKTYRSPKYTEVIEDHTTKLTSSTNYDDWIKVSARAAWIFWFTNRRRSLPADQSAELAAWQHEAPAYRARIRRALRLLEAEDLGLAVGSPQPSLDWSTPARKKLAARMAWILWMIEHRESAPADPTYEIAEWQRTAQTEHTKSMQRALAVLASEGIVLTAE